MVKKRFDFKLWSFNRREDVKGKGIYVLRANIKILKPFDTDDHGILYIGQSDSLERRLRVVKTNKSFKDDYDKTSDKTLNHSTLTFCLDFDEKYELVFLNDKENGTLYSTLATPFLYYAYPRKHKVLEKKLLCGHVMKYGQLPCFNSTGSSLRKVYNNDKYEEIEKFYGEFENELKECVTKLS